MKKKGISPLIATVLIIGFTIALAVVIMTWGFDFFEEMIEGRTTEANEQLRCAKVDLEITGDPVCDATTDTIKITVDNLKTPEAISSFKVRVTTSDDTVVIPVDTGVEAVGVETLTIDGSGSDIENAVVNAIEVIPLLKGDDGEEFICTEVSEKKTGLNCDLSTS